MRLYDVSNSRVGMEILPIKILTQVNGTQYHCPLGGVYYINRSILPYLSSSGLIYSTKRSFSNQIEGELQVGVSFHLSA